MYIIGIDGGGTSTQGALADGELNILAEAEVDGTNYHNIGLEATRDRLEALLKQLLTSAGISMEQLSGICLGGAGIDSENDREAISGLFRAIGWKGPLLAVNDGVAALVGGNRGLDGMVLISGTGSIGLASYEGQTLRCGGWGHLIDDVGSGYYLGVSALKGIMEACDGRRGPTKLWKPIAEHLGIGQEEDLIHFLYHPQRGKEKIAELAPYVIQLAKEDTLASEIVEEAMTGLLKIVGALMNQMPRNVAESQGKILLSLGGSLLIKSEVYREAFIKAVGEKYTEIEVHLPYEGPVVGALRIINDYIVKERKSNA